MLQGYTMAIVPCGNPTPKILPRGGGEWPTFRTARAQRTVRPLWVLRNGPKSQAKAPGGPQKPINVFRHMEGNPNQILLNVYKGTV